MEAEATIPPRHREEASMQQSGKDLLLACTLFSVGLGAVLYIQYGPGEALQTSRDAQITFRSFPTVIAALLMLLSALYSVGSVVSMFSKGGAKPIEDVENGNAASARRPPYLFARMAALVVLLIAFSQMLGEAPFILLAGIFLAIAFVIFGQTHPVKILAVAVLGGALFHGLFVSILKLPLY